MPPHPSGEISWKVRSGRNRRACGLEEAYSDFRLKRSSTKFAVPPVTLIVLPIQKVAQTAAATIARHSRSSLPKIVAAVAIQERSVVDADRSRNFRRVSRAALSRCWIELGNFGHKPPARRPAAAFHRQKAPARAIRWRSQFPFADADMFSNGLQRPQFRKRNSFVSSKRMKPRPKRMLSPRPGFECFRRLFIRRAFDVPLVRRFIDLFASLAFVPVLRGADYRSFRSAAACWRGRRDARLRRGPVRCGRSPLVCRQPARSISEHARADDDPSAEFLPGFSTIFKARSSERFQCFIQRLQDRAFALQIMNEYPVLARQLVHRADRRFASSSFVSTPFGARLADDPSDLRSR